MKRILQFLRGFFFPPIGTPRWLRLLPYAVLGVLTLVVLVSAAYAWDYTNSPEFCGTACHTMPPEFTAYLTSPHARVDCVECHIGRGFIATRITRKAGDAQHIISLVFKDYEFPIRADNLRPARDTCERCHFPEKFSDDSLREIKQFRDDQSNTPQSLYLTLKTGGGSARQGLGRGIHWHIENQVFFQALDPEEQEIPYVRVVNGDGSIDEYFDLEADFGPEQVQEDELHRMDCITCHNRITHLILTPEDTVDRLMNRGEISATIPEIRRKAVEVYGARYETNELGLNGIAGLEGYYQTYYPEFYRENQSLIEEAVVALQTAYAGSVFPEQGADWRTHANNIGHQLTPGCFRCHGGQHLNNMGESIRLECNLCHSIPVTTGPSDFVANIEISRGPEPESHKNSNWINLHRDVFDPTCENCHTTGNPGGSDNSSFCANSACHGNVYTFAGFDAPGLREILLSQLPPPPVLDIEPGPLTFADTIGDLFALRCGACHAESGIQGLNLTNYEATLAGGFSGPALLPGDPDGSLVIQKTTAAQPHFSQFTPDELDMLIEWIEAGAPN